MIVFRWLVVHGGGERRFRLSSRLVHPSGWNFFVIVSRGNLRICFGNVACSYEDFLQTAFSTLRNRGRSVESQVGDDPSFLMALKLSIKCVSILKASPVKPLPEANVYRCSRISCACMISITLLGESDGRCSCMTLDSISSKGRMRKHGRSEEIRVRLHWMPQVIQASRLPRTAQSQP